MADHEYILKFKKKKPFLCWSDGMLELRTLGANVTTLDANLDYLGLSYWQNNQIAWKSIPFLVGLAV